MNITRQVSHLLGILGLRTIYILGLGLGLDNQNSKCALFYLNTKFVQQ